MAESTDGKNCRREKYPSKGVIHWVIEPRCYNIDHIEIWGENECGRYDKGRFTITR